jgi:hypothetical protein
MGLTIKEIEEEVVRRIVALDSSRYHYSELPAEAVQGWHESREPLTAIESTQGCQHLAFSASVEDAPAADDDSGNPLLGWQTIDCSLVVVFLYKLPATEQTPAARLATEAARDIARALMSSWPEVTVTLRQRYKPGPVDTNGFMPVEMRFTVQTDEPF